MSFRGILNDGCGVLVPIDDQIRNCRTGAAHGIDASTNEQPMGHVPDQGTASPVVLPDGNILVGTQSGYNYGRGHTFKVNPQGEVLATYDFGWDMLHSEFKRFVYSFVAPVEGGSSPGLVAARAAD